MWRAGRPISRRRLAAARLLVFGDAAQPRVLLGQLVDLSGSLAGGRLSLLHQDVDDLLEQLFDACPGHRGGFGVDSVDFLGYGRVPW